MENKKIGIYNPLTNEEKQWIMDNHYNKSVLEMSKELKRGVAKIYEFMDSENLEIFCHQPPRRGNRSQYKSGYFRENLMNNWLVY